MQGELREQGVTTQQLRSELSVSANTVSDMEAERSVNTNSISELEESLLLRQQAIQGKDIALEDLREDVTRKSSDLKSLTEELDELKAVNLQQGKKIAQVEKDHAELQQKYELQQAEFEKLSLTLTGKEHEIDGLKKSFSEQLEVLLQNIRAFESEVSNLNNRYFKYGRRD